MKLLWHDFIPSCQGGIFMETRYNEATYNRPEGDRVIDAPFLLIDLEKYERQIKEEEAWQKNDRNGITVFKTDNLTIVLTCLHAGANIPENSIDGVVAYHLLQGELELKVMDEVIPLRAKQITTFHAGVKHSIHAADDALLLITTQRTNPTSNIV